MPEICGAQVLRWKCNPDFEMVGKRVKNLNYNKRLSPISWAEYKRRKPTFYSFPNPIHYNSLSRMSHGCESCVSLGGKWISLSRTSSSTESWLSCYLLNIQTDTFWSISDLRRSLLLLSQIVCKVLCTKFHGVHEEKTFHTLLLVQSLYCSKWGCVKNDSVNDPVLLNSGLFLIDFLNHCLYYRIAYEISFDFTIIL